MQVVGFHRASPSATLDNIQYNNLFITKCQAKNDKNLTTPKDARHIITPAVKTPKKIDKNDLENLISKRPAIKAPVQAPVIGSGIATNKNKPKTSNLLTFLLLFSAF